MRGDQRRKRRLEIIILIEIMILTLAALVSSVTSTFADETVSITCYSGYPPNNEYVGTVTIFDVPTAANACNIMYYDCRRRCIGCYVDFELVEDVCVDSRGNTFLK